MKRSLTQRPSAHTIRSVVSRWAVSSSGPPGTTESPASWLPQSTSPNTTTTTASFGRVGSATKRLSSRDDDRIVSQYGGALLGVSPEEYPEKRGVGGYPPSSGPNNGA